MKKYLSCILDNNDLCSFQFIKQPKASSSYLQKQIETIHFGTNLTQVSMSNKPNYKTYCFQHQNNIMFFYYNHNHPIMTKNYKFQLGKIKIFMHNDRVLSCQITSNPHLNLSLDWNQEYFAKLFHGLSKFQLEGSGDEYDDSLSLLVRDHFQQSQQIYLMRAKLTEEYGYEVTNEFWHVFKNYNLQKIKALETMQEENLQLTQKADVQLTRLIEFQNKKQDQKNRLKGQLSALLREKQAKLKEFNQTFNYFNNKKQIEPSLDLSQQKDSMSIAGSLFLESQQFMFPN